MSPTEPLQVVVDLEQIDETVKGHITVAGAATTEFFGWLELIDRLDRAVDFEALDNQPVDLIFLLLAPEGAGADHLKALARIARLLRDPSIAHKLRASHDAESLYAVLAMPSASAA